MDGNYDIVIQGAIITNLSDPYITSSSGSFGRTLNPKPETLNPKTPTSVDF